MSQTYISSSDKAFTAATIEAIGRVACSISAVTETCLHGLMSLLSHKDGKGSSSHLFLIDLHCVWSCRDHSWWECCGHQETPSAACKLCSNISNYNVHACTHALIAVNFTLLMDLCTCMLCGCFADVSNFYIRLAEREQGPDNASGQAHWQSHCELDIL